MSNALAIAAVTETLVNLLTNNIDNANVPGAWVSATSPDQKPPSLAVPGINVFLYQITPNTALRNADLPTRATDGTLLRKPQAAVDLHYLLTFNGDYSTLEPQRLLGSATLALHANPTLPRSLIQSVQTNNSFLNTSNLDTQSQLIRFTPIVFSLEELSKLWSFLLKIDYTLSSAYIASVVLIETDGPEPPAPLPVLTYQLQVQPIRTPVITRVVASSGPDAPITAGSTIIIGGHDFIASGGEATQILIGNETVTPGATAQRQLTVTLPLDLPAGSLTVQVVQPLLLGSPPVAHPGTGNASAPVAFVLAPMIAASSPPGGFAVSVNPAFGSPPGPAITVTVIPTIRIGQRVLLHLLSLASPPGPGRLFDGGTLTADSDTVTIPIPNLPAGQYMVRVLVDGAESPLPAGPGGVPSVTV